VQALERMRGRAEEARHRHRVVGQRFERYLIVVVVSIMKREREREKLCVCVSSTRAESARTRSSDSSPAGTAL
jgi:hypothetical protein